MLVCPNCRSALTPLEEIFGYFCGECGWDVPSLQSADDDEVTIERVVVRTGSHGEEWRLRAWLEFAEEPLLEMEEGAWKSYFSTDEPRKVGRDEPPPDVVVLGATDYWWYGGRFWTTKELDLSAEVIPVAAAAWTDWERRRQELSQRREEEDARNSSIPDCPACESALASLEDSFDYYCENCAWLVPLLERPEEDDLLIERVSVRTGLFGKESGFRVRLQGADKPLLEMAEGAWTSYFSTDEPRFVGRWWVPDFEGVVGQDYWWYRDQFWKTHERDLSPQAITVAWAVSETREKLVREREEEDARIALAEAEAREDRRRAKLAWADAKLAGAAGQPRQRIPRDVRYTVFQRDGGRCVECGSSFDLQYDHEIPIALGGANTVDNLQLLCGDCNRRKGATLG